MPIQAIALAAVLLSAQSPAGAPLIERVASPCHVMVDGVCKVERKPTGPTAGSGGDGGNATNNYNFYLGGPTAGNGGNGGDVKMPPGVPGKAPQEPTRGRQDASNPTGDVEGAVTYFTWTYNFEPEPGKRIWSRSGSRWSERYPSGTVAKVYNTVLPGTVQGCVGQMVSHTADLGFEVFIPNKGCSRMVALFRRDMGAWGALGQMREVR